MKIEINFSRLIIVFFAWGIGSGLTGGVIGMEYLKREIHEAFKVVDNSPVNTCLKEHFEDLYGDDK
tara:strand:+ start:6883 stop:7080 length:198 start_codon:yes stop_codon:yes gene_type:complete